MGSKNRGLILDLLDGRYGTALHKDQIEDLAKTNRAVIRVYEDQLCTKPIMENGKQKVVIKHASRFKVIGYTD